MSLAEIINADNTEYEKYSNRADEIEQAVQKNTRVIYIETPSNPLLLVTDIAATAQIAKANNVLSIIDNTFATPYLCRPFEHGANIVTHSTTKFIGGHGTSIGGGRAMMLAKHQREQGGPLAIDPKMPIQIS